MPILRLVIGLMYEDSQANSVMMVQIMVSQDTVIQHVEHEDDSIVEMKSSMMDHQTPYMKVVEYYMDLPIIAERN